MNHVYSLIWNEATHAWAVAPENARARGKRSRAVLLGAAALAMLLLPAVHAQTLPAGGSVAHGRATISQSGSNLTVTQASKNAVLNWNSFSVGGGARAHFENGTGATLNRVTGSLPSFIDGSLSATGSLYLVNRNGVVVGSKGVINAAGFMATTLDVRDDEFMAGGALRFFGDSRAGIVNLGSIHADSGNVALVAHSVRNDGAISAPNGAAELLAGQEIFLASPDALALLVSLGEGAASTGETGVTNNGLIEAAQARMQAANGNLYALAVNQGGIIRATGVSNKEGRIVLTADGGTVQQNGKLSAQNADGSGGKILVGGDYQGSNASVANATSTIVTRNAEMDASATAAQGDGGRVIVWANEDTVFAGSIKARGGDQGGNGGFVEVSGKNTLDFRPNQPIDLSAKAGKVGTVLLDPNEIEVVATASGPNQVAVSVIEAGLASANYVLTTSNFDPHEGDGHITISNDLNWTSANTLTLESGNSININANITGANGGLKLYAGRYAFGAGEGGPGGFIDGGITLAANKTINVDTLRFGTNADSLPAGYTFGDEESNSTQFSAYGTLRVNTLELDFAGGGAGLIAENAQNAIGALRTIGSGNLSFVSVVDGEGDLRVRLNSTDSTGNGVYIVTPGNLTLEAGSFLSFAESGSVPDVVLASTGGNFINEAGSTVFGDHLRYLIYTGTRGGTGKGGLTGTEEYSRSYAGNPPDDYDGDSISRFLFVQSAATPQLTYRADDLTRFYGDVNPTLTYSVSGLLAGDVLNNVVTGSPLLFTSATMQSGVGAYIINISQGTLSSSSYDFLFTPGALTINAAPLTLDIDNLSRYYGDTNPLLTARVSGLKAGDTAADILAGWKLSTDATRASGVGSYGIDASWLGTGSANYIYTVNPGSLAINRTPITLTLGPTFRTYGDANPDFRAWAMLAGTYNGDTVATAFPTSIFSTLATPGSSVGAYAVGASGFDNPNYVLTIGDLGALTIGKATLVINANNASRRYGDADPVFSASATGWRNGDTLASIPGLVLTSNTTGSTNVGSYAIVPAGSATNYDFVAGTGTLTIDKAFVDVRLDAATRYYGDNDPAFTATYAGLRNGETSLPGLSPVSNTDMYTSVGNYLVLPGGTTTFQNYLPTFYAGALTIAPRPLMVNPYNVNRTYGVDNPAFPVFVENATAWDAAQAARYWVGSSSATQRSDVGNYAITASANPHGAPFDNLGNYAVTINPGTLSVARAPVNVVANPVSIIWGDGLPPISYSFNGGLMPWDNEGDLGQAQLTSVAGGTNAAPGQYAITLASSALGKNYTAVLEGTPFVDVLRRPIIITGNYDTSFAQLQQIYAGGQIEPFVVRRYDSNGKLTEYLMTTPLAGGPQFSVMLSSDGTRGEGLGVFVSNAFIQPAAGGSMDDVLRYYDPVSKPGTAQTLNTNSDIVRDVLPPAPGVIVVSNPNQSGAPLEVRNLTAPGEAPSMRNLLLDAYPDADAMMEQVRALFDIAAGTGQQAYATNQLLSTLPLELRQKLLEAGVNDKAWKSLQQEAADTEKWMADLAAARPRASNYDALMASAQSSLASIRAEMDGMPSYDSIYRQVMSGDPQLVQQFVPLVTAGLLNAQRKGELASDTQNKLLALINDQRAKTVAAADAKYAAIMGQDHGLVALASAPKIPDIVGTAYVDAAANQMALAQGLVGTAGLAVGAGTALAVTLGVASQVLSVAQGGKSLFDTVSVAVGSAHGAYTAGAGGLAATAGPAIIVAAALAIGIAEINQLAESTKNYERYVSFKAANGQMTSLAAFDMSKSDNMMQMVTAMSAMMTESMGKLAQ